MAIVVAAHADALVTKVAASTANVADDSNKTAAAAAADNSETPGLIIAVAADADANAYDDSATDDSTVADSNLLL